MRFEEDWVTEETTISREELGNIIAEEIIAVDTSMKDADFDRETKNLIRELLLMFSASVAAEIFNGER